MHAELRREEEKEEENTLMSVAMLASRSSSSSSSSSVHIAGCGEDGWTRLSLSSPPSPPFRWDPRLAWRIHSPQTPSPSVYIHSNDNDNDNDNDTPTRTRTSKGNDKGKAVSSGMRIDRNSAAIVVVGTRSRSRSGSSSSLTFGQDGSSAASASYAPSLSSSSSASGMAFSSTALSRSHSCVSSLTDTTGTAQSSPNLSDASTSTSISSTSSAVNGTSASSHPQWLPCERDQQPQQPLWPAPQSRITVAHPSVSTTTFAQPAMAPHYPSYLVQQQPNGIRQHPQPPLSLSQSTAHAPVASTSTGARTLASYNPISLLTRRHNRPASASTSLPSHSPPTASSFPAPSQQHGHGHGQVRAARGRGVAKLSRLRLLESPSASPSTGKPRKRAAKAPTHAHKRSYSVQWQQHERWRSKSRARLRDLLGLLCFMLGATLILYQICTLGLSGAASAPASAFRLRPSAAARHSPLMSLAHLPHPHRDTVAIYRIIGNDLPPRHQRGQSVRNLRFMLSHESDFSFIREDSRSYGVNIEKYYVLNRITDDQALADIAALFPEFDVPPERVLNIPFEWHEYAKRELRWDGGVARPANMWGIAGPSWSSPSASPSLGSDAGTETARNGTSATLAQPEHLKWAGLSEQQREDKQARWETLARLRAMEYTLHDKNLYAMNNNGGRNFALEHGRSLPHVRWILPLDGNCFFTPPALSSMLQSIVRRGESYGDDRASKPYAIIPMARLLDNGAVLPENTAAHSATPSQHARTAPADPLELEYALPDAPEEPQIAFRWDAAASYEPEMRYGRRSKLELLWRLGAMPFSRALHVRKLAWEAPDHAHITEGSYGSLSMRAQAAAAAAAEARDGTDTNAAWLRAGWVHRLFSGEREQEESSKAALELRRLNRMKGIVAYLERLDERLVRGEAGCPPGASALGPSAPTARLAQRCGFSKDRLWSWDDAALADLKRKASIDSAGAQSRIGAFEDRSMRVVSRVRNQLDRWTTAQWEDALPEDVARTVAQLALVGYLSSNSSFSYTAAELIRARFLLPLERHSGELASTAPLRRLPLPASEGHGYMFPASIQSTQPNLWNNMPSLADAPFFLPTTFDPTLLLDALRLLSPAFQPSLSISLRALVPPHQLRALAAKHLRTLIASPEGVALSNQPPSLFIAAQYDASVAALAAYLDDASLLTRVLARYRLRYIEIEESESASANADAVLARRQVDAMLAGMRSVGMLGLPEESSVMRDALDRVFGL